MENNKKKSKKGWLLGGGAVLIAAVVFFSGLLNFNLPGRQNPPADAPTTVAENEAAGQAEAVLEINGNQLLYQGEALAVDAIADTFKEGQRVLIKSADAKQLFYDEVIAALTEAGCVIIEE